MSEIFSLSITDNSEKILDEMRDDSIRALVRVGMQAEGYAKDLCPVDTGQLRNSISHKVDDGEQVVYIGSNLDYAAYVELGTGKYAEGGGGRPTPWVYQDSKGNWHYTRGNPAQPFLKPAVADHAQTYRNIIEDEMKNG